MKDFDPTNFAAVGDTIEALTALAETCDDATRTVVINAMGSLVFLTGEAADLAMRNENMNNALIVFARMLPHIPMPHRLTAAQALKEVIGGTEPWPPVKH